jgi:hypothetical protein
MIYLASPYTHPLEEIRAHRYVAVHKYTSLLMQRGATVFSPIVYGHQFRLLGPQVIPHTFWIDFNYTILKACKECRVLKLRGWEQSAGIHAEIAYAFDNDITLTFVEEKEWQE